MRNKKNYYKRKRNYRVIFNKIGSILFTVFLASFFCFLGYSVARPFARIGEVDIEQESSISPLKDYIEPLEDPADSGIRVYWLKDDEIDNMELFKSKVRTISKTYNTIVVPLKLEGGKLKYHSVNDEVQLAEANGEAELSEIASVITEVGITPAASVNVAQDNLYPKMNTQAAFLLKDSQKLWLDASVSNNGKPWLNPASSAAKEYTSSITGEIAQAGFKYVIATNAEYPEFSQEALDALDGDAADEKRYLNLVDMVNGMVSTAQSKGSDVWIEISADDLFEGKCEVFDSMLLETQNTVLKIDLAKFDSEMVCDGERIDFSDMTAQEKIKKICSIAETYIYKTSFIPEVTSGNGLSANQANLVEEIFEELGYTSFIVK